MCFRGGLGVVSMKNKILMYNAANGMVNSIIIHLKHVKNINFPKMPSDLWKDTTCTALCIAVSEDWDSLRSVNICLKPSGCGFHSIFIVIFHNYICTIHGPSLKQPCQNLRRLDSGVASRKYIFPIKIAKQGRLLDKMDARAFLVFFL